MQGFFVGVPSSMESKRHSVQYKLYPTFKKYKIIYNLSTKKAPPSGARVGGKNRKSVSSISFGSSPVGADFNVTLARYF